MGNANGENGVRVVAGIVRRGDTILLARRRPGDSLAGYWEFPGGKIEAGETPKEALSRELYEEFGVSIRVGRYVGAREHTYPHATIQLIVYEAELTGEIARLTAHDAIAWIRPDELSRYQLAPADAFLCELIGTRNAVKQNVPGTTER